jgi:hypothetical protein
MCFKFLPVTSKISQGALQNHTNTRQISVVLVGMFRGNQNTENLPPVSGKALMAFQMNGFCLNWYQKLSLKRKFKLFISQHLG